MQALRRQGQQVDALDNRPALRPELENAYDLIITWALGRRKYNAAGAPEPVGIDTVQSVYNAFGFSGQFSMRDFAGMVAAMDAAALEHHFQDKG